MLGSILTVLTPAPDRRLATAADVRAQLGASGPSVTDNDLNALILQASDAVATCCGGRVFGREGLREIFRQIRGLGSLILTRDHVSAISSIVADGATLVADVDFEADLRAGLIYRLAGDARTSWNASRIAVEYSAGWLLPSQSGCDLPGDVRRVCIERVARVWNARGRDATIRSESSQDVGQVSYIDPGKFSAEEAEALARYRVFRL